MLQVIANLGGWLLMMGQHDRSESLFYYFRIEDQVSHSFNASGEAVTNRPWRLTGIAVLARRWAVWRSVMWSYCVSGSDPAARTLHALRHTFAINYLRRGGSVFHLQKVLGHSSLEMTRRYANLMTEDLQAVHEKVSLLSR